MKLFVALLILLHAFFIAAEALPFSFNPTNREKPLLSTFNGLAKSSEKFKCHHKPTQPILAKLSTYITHLFRTHRDEIFGRKGGPDLIPVEECMAGYEEDDVSPAVFISQMTKRQLEKLEKICKKQLPMEFPGSRFSIVKSGKGLALVQDGNEKLKRRNTI